MKNPTFIKSSIIFTTVVGFILYFPLVFANSITIERRVIVVGVGDNVVDKPVVADEAMVHTVSLYDSMQLEAKGLSKTAFVYGVTGFYRLLRSERIENDNIISIVDFSQPSYKKRLFVIDLAKAKIIFNTYVAHGVNSGTSLAHDFSNKIESNKSSLGFYETLNTYMGSHGYSLRLEGLEKGINDNANRRDIVIHGANYVSERMINAQGYIGRSFGCPALPEKLYKPIINTIKNGTCLFIYSNNKSYLKKSAIING